VRLALPYIWRFIILRRLIWLSTWPLLQRVSTAANTAERSFWRPNAKRTNDPIPDCLAVSIQARIRCPSLPLENPRPRPASKAAQDKQYKADQIASLLLCKSVGGPSSQDCSVSGCDSLQSVRAQATTWPPPTSCQLSNHTALSSVTLGSDLVKQLGGIVTTGVPSALQVFGELLHFGRLSHRGFRSGNSPARGHRRIVFL
jgi:hypothetical protein